MITISWRPARFVLDALLILLGLVFGLLAANESMWALRYANYSLKSVGCFGPVSYDFVASMTAACLCLGWSVVLVLFCGRDLIQGRRRELTA